jgi:hypothetical protein
MVCAAEQMLAEKRRAMASSAPSSATEKLTA